MTRYVAHPGPIISRYDGQTHHITGADLRRLYGVPGGSPVVTIEDAADEHHFTPAPGDVHLWPDPTGSYQMPEPTR
jgi:hypothetical protein